MSLTINDSSNRLFAHFSNNNSFNLKRDFLKLVPITLCEADDRASVQLALNEYVENKLVKEFNGYFILIQPFDSFVQNIPVHPATATGISSVINRYCEMIQNKSEEASAKNILERDLINLLNIISNLAESSAPKEDKTE